MAVPSGEISGAPSSAQFIGQLRYRAGSKHHFVNLEKPPFTKCGVDHAFPIGRQGRVIMLAGIIRRQSAESCAIGIDDADLAGGL